LGQYSPLTLAELRGKVVLVDFWTYTCINWRRTLPYIREWSKKYKNQGLVAIGVHTPEFSFEHKFENAGHSINDMDIEYPVACDNDYAIWEIVFKNQFWPALYLIDANGQIRYQKFG
jgi:thiol-disulfide isomerase/thioredoxin